MHTEYHISKNIKFMENFCYVGQYGGKSFKISLSSFSCLGVIYCVL